MISPFLGMWMSAAVAGSATVDVGLAHRQVREDILVPKTFAGAGLALGGGWRHDGPQHHGRVHLGLPFVVLANRFGHLGAAWSLDLDGSWDAEVAPLLHGTVAVGAAVHGDMDVYFHAQWDDSHIFWLTQWGIGPRVAWRRPLRKQAVELWTSLPLLMAVSRPPGRWETKVENAVNPLFHVSRSHSGMRVTSLHRAVDWHGGIDWSHPQPRGAIVLGVSCRVATAVWPEPVSSLAVVASFERRLGGGQR